MSDQYIKEDVPSFLKRQGDRVVAGSNNNMLIFGTDRVSTLESGHGHVNSSNKGVGAGSMYAVVGMVGENYSLKDDKTFIYMSMKNDVDNNISSKEEFVTNNVPSMILKSDSIRMLARNDFKIIVGDAYITIKNGKVVVDGDLQLGSGAVERIIKGDSFKKYFLGHSHPTPTGPSGPVLQPFPDALLSKNRFVK